MYRNYLSYKILNFYRFKLLQGSVTFSKARLKEIFKSYEINMNAKFYYDQEILSNQKCNEPKGKQNILYMCIVYITTLWVKVLPPSWHDSKNFIYYIRRILSRTKITLLVLSFFKSYLEGAGLGHMNKIFSHSFFYQPAKKWNFKSFFST